MKMGAKHIISHLAKQASIQSQRTAMLNFHKELLLQVTTMELQVIYYQSTNTPENQQNQLLKKFILQKELKMENFYYLL